MESLTAGFVHICSAIVSFLFVEGKLVTRLWLDSILRFSQYFLIS